MSANRLVALASDLERFADRARLLADRFSEEADTTTWSGTAARSFMRSAATRVCRCRDYGDELAGVAASMRHLAEALFDLEQRRRAAHHPPGAVRIVIEAG
jgi:hypothetical protein